MKRGKHTEEQIAFALKQAELDTTVEEMRRKIGILDATFTTAQEVWRPRAVGARLLFDLDGTLAQTEHLHHAAFNALLAAYGRSIDDPTFLEHVSGRSNEDITAYPFPDLDLQGRERLADDKERWFREPAATGVEATPGAPSLIDWAAREASPRAS